MPRHGDLVRVVTWRIDAWQPVDLEQLTTAARRASNANDFQLAERLAATARAAGAGVDAGIVLAETWMITGRHEDASALLAALATEARTDRERVDVADSHAITLGLLLGREHEAVAVMTDTLALVDEPGWSIRWARRSPSCWCRSHGHLALGTSVRFRPEGQFTGPVYALCAAGRLWRSRRTGQPWSRRRRHRPRHRPPVRVRVAERPGRRPRRPAHLRPLLLR